jgi:succinyl-CoA synthetase beta subunit
VPVGIAAHSAKEAVAAAEKIGDAEVVIKSQILAGGRGLGTIWKSVSSGYSYPPPPGMNASCCAPPSATYLQGGVHVIKKEQVEAYANKMLGGTLVTKQSGPEGKPITTLLMAKKMELVNEMYLSITLDRTTMGPLIVACAKGGTSIEDTAAEDPSWIIKCPVDISKGITKENTKTVVDGLIAGLERMGVASQLKDKKEDAYKQIENLYNMFVKYDCTMVEVNPIAEDPSGLLLAADAKIGFDDNAFFRQQEVFDEGEKNVDQVDPREVAAAEFDLNYVGLDGNIGCMVNGAGLAMATMDIASQKGGEPANFLDVGGSASVKNIKGAFEIITRDPKVKCILVNIFGGIMKCDVIAEGVKQAAAEMDLKIPLVVRLEGTNVAAGNKIIKDANLETLISADDLDDAAEKAVQAIS